MDSWLQRGKDAPECWAAWGDTPMALKWPAAGTIGGASTVLNPGGGLQGVRAASSKHRSAASVSHRGPGLSRIDPDGDADSVIKIEGTLDRPVLKRATAFMYVFCGATVGDNPGSAIGATTVWQLVLRLPREQFTDLLVIITAQRLVEVDLVLDGLSRGTGKVRSASFYTEPVPYERDEDNDET